MSDALRLLQERSGSSRHDVRLQRFMEVMFVKPDEIGRGQ